MTLPLTKSFRANIELSAAYKSIEDFFSLNFKLTNIMKDLDSEFKIQSIITMASSNNNEPQTEETKEQVITELKPEPSNSATQLTANSTKFLGKRIKQLRKEKGLSLSQLASMTQTSHTYLSMLENRKSQNPSSDKLIKLAEVLDVTLDYLLATTKVPHKNIMTVDYICPATGDATQLPIVDYKKKPSKRKIMKIKRHITLATYVLQYLKEKGSANNDEIRFGISRMGFVTKSRNANLIISQILFKLKSNNEIKKGSDKRWELV